MKVGKTPFAFLLRIHAKREGATLSVSANAKATAVSLHLHLVVQRAEARWVCPFRGRPSSHQYAGQVTYFTFMSPCLM